MGGQGYFRYIGTGEEVIEIPHVIQGVEIISYYRMFYQTGEDVKKVISTNESVTNMSNMFRDSQATLLDLSSFDTSNVTNMSNMFRDSQATSVIFGDQFDTSNVTHITYMFYNSQATSLDLSSFDTSNVTSMSNMFRYSQATSLDLSSFDTSNVINMINMFRDSQARLLDLSSFDTSNVTYMQSMFQNSKATTGYARTRNDVNRLNESSRKPANLTFRVKSN